MNRIIHWEEAYEEVDESRDVVVGRWREALDILAIRTLRVRDAEVPASVEALRELADSQGLSQVLSPMVDSARARAYEAAGMCMREELVVVRMELRHLRRMARSASAGFAFRIARTGDIQAIDNLDSSCFDSFWAYDRRYLEALVSSSKLTVATDGPKIIGYTHTETIRGSATLGRIAVAPEFRGRGVGSSLLAEAGRTLSRTGARTMSLCARIDDHVSRSLYARHGGIELEETLSLMIGPTCKE